MTNDHDHSLRLLMAGIKESDEFDDIENEVANVFEVKSP